MVKFNHIYVINNKVNESWEIILITAAAENHIQQKWWDSVLNVFKQKIKIKSTKWIPWVLDQKKICPIKINNKIRFYRNKQIRMFKKIRAELLQLTKTKTN